MAKAQLARTVTARLSLGEAWGPRGCGDPRRWEAGDGSLIAEGSKHTTSLGWTGRDRPHWPRLGRHPVSDRMPRVCLWAPCSLWLLSACFSTREAGAAPAGAAPCLDAGELRRFSEDHKRLPPTNECMLNCTVHTYMKIFRQEKRITVRLHNSVTASENEYCWPSYLRCWDGQQLDKAFVFLDTEEGKINSSTNYGLSSATAMSARRFQVAPQTTSSVMSELCGIKFDTTNLFKTTANNFCVQVTCQDTISTSCDSVNATLKCPPFLATIWSRFQQPLG